MKSFAAKNTTSTKNIKNFQSVAIQKEQLKTLKGGDGDEHIINDFIEDEVLQW